MFSNCQPAPASIASLPQTRALRAVSVAPTFVALAVALAGATAANAQSSADRVAQDVAKVNEAYLVGPKTASELGCTITWQALIPLPSGHSLRLVSSSPEGILALNTRNEVTLVRPATGDRAWTASDTLKNVVVRLRHPDGSSEVLVVGVPGDREVDMKRLEAQLAPAEVEPLDDAGFASHPSLVRGYIGPQILGTESPSGLRYLCDPAVVDGSTWVTGANVADTHVLNLVRGRDFTPDGEIEAVQVLAGDPCPSCGSALEIARGIEIGHVFQLGRKYADKLGLAVLDKNGKQVTVTMGSYGVGVSRAVASIAEVHHDEIGLKWPRSVAPADVHLVIAGKNDDDIVRAAESLAADLESAGLEVLIDDRNGVSPGVKFKDAELIGIPTIVVVGKSLADGTVEVRDRHTGSNEAIPVAEAVAAVVRLARGE